MNKEQYFLENLDKIKEIMAGPYTISSLCKEFHMKNSTLCKYLKKYNISYHTNQGSKGIFSKGYKPALYYINNNICISNSNLRYKLIKDGIKEKKCECCGLSEWMNLPIPLELHHRNFSHYDNSLDNLEILCSNCHMQKHNYNNNIKNK